MISTENLGRSLMKHPFSLKSDQLVRHPILCHYCQIFALTEKNSLSGTSLPASLWRASIYHKVGSKIFLSIYCDFFLF